MEGIKKPPYEISIWDDVNKYHIKRNGIWEDVITLPKDGSYEIGYQFFDEEKVAVIGGNDLSSPFRAHDSVRRKGVNGNTTLTFNLFNNIYDPQTREYLSNPFVKLLVNERKVKLRLGEADAPNLEWYDFVIKDIQESSDNKTFSYTAIGLEVNELSKVGFNIELNTELENNQGSIQQLGKTVTAETDWVIDSSPTVRQWIEEPIYEVSIDAPLTATSPLNGEILTLPTEQIKKLYLFYDDIVKQNTQNVQFILAEELSKVDNNNIVKQPKVYKITSDFTWKDGTPSFSNQKPIVYLGARAERLEYRQRSRFESALDRQVYEYAYATSGGDKQTLFGYKDTEYISPALIKNVLVNTQDFTHTDGWGYKSSKADGAAGDANIEISYNVDPFQSGWLEATPCLVFRFDKEVTFTNVGVFSNKNYLKTLAKGDEFKLRITTRDNELASLTPYFNFGIEAFHGKTQTKKTILNFTNVNRAKPRIYEGMAKVLVGMSEKDFDIGVPLFTMKSGSSFRPTLAIEKIELFRVVRDEKGLIIEPGSLTTEEAKPLIVDKYYYYNRDLPANKEAKDAEDFIYEYIGKEPMKGAVPVYNDDNSNGKGFEKVRSINVKESNVFNIIQSLCETFECWAKFNIQHDSQGKILQEEITIPGKDGEAPQIRKRQKKSISFVESVGKENYAGFRYGVNLKSIQRRLDANQLATKVVVKDNKNEFAPGGFCSITRAAENPCKENFILNFDYYIQHQLMNSQTLVNDLYDSSLSQTQKTIGLYPKLFALNKEAQIKIEENASMVAGQSEIEAQQKTASLNLVEANSLNTRLQGELHSNFGKTYDYLKDHKDDTLLKNQVVVDYMNQIRECQRQIAFYDKKETEYQSALKSIIKSKEANEIRLNEIRKEKEKLNKQFFSKYSRFIQEGTWISEDYIDDNLYYLDAYNVAALSAFPKVTYTINVLGLEGNEEYRGYSFDVGDISYVEDTEFFGWYYSAGSNLRTPYHERVIVSERTDYLDSPENNQIHVQNYNTQFEDLFQRIEATTQTVQYSSGAYNKVSSIINPDGSISKDTLQNSFSNNAFIIQNAKDQSVVWGDKGITITNLSRPNEIVRLVSSGILLSNDGGNTYAAGITANGINANFITTGQVDTNVINIMNGRFPSFRWDKQGLSAYAMLESSVPGRDPVFNFNNFVRFDQYGLYGLTNADSMGSIFTPDANTWGERLDQVIEKADFSLTWKGFRIKSGDKDSYIDISSDKDFRVVDKNRQRIKIGNIGTPTEKKYGFAIYDNTEEAVMTTNEKGELWLLKELQVGTKGIGNTVRIGNIESITSPEHGHAVINAYHSSTIGGAPQIDSQFLVYEDGHLIAKSGEFTGTIHATGGTIGNLEIDEIANIGYEVHITSDKGTIIKDEATQLTLTAELYRGGKPVTTGIVSYQWYKGGVLISEATKKTLIVRGTEMKTDIEQFSCEITVQ